MNGFASGAVAGVVVGAAALAGLSLVGPHGPAPDRIGVVAAVQDGPAWASAVQEEVPAPQAAVAEAGPEVAVEAAPEATGIEAPATGSGPQVSEAESGLRVLARSTGEAASVESAAVTEAALAGSVDEAARLGAEEAAEVEAVPARAEPGASSAEGQGEPTAEEAPEPIVAGVPKLLGAEVPKLPEAEPLSPEQALGLVAPGISEPAASGADDPETVAEVEPIPATEPSAPVAEADMDEVAAIQAVPGDEPALPGRVRVGGSAMPGRDAVRVNRPGAEALVGDSGAEVAAEEPALEDAPALRRHAAAWEAPAEAKPRLALVLLDDGATDPKDVAALPWPVSVALDPLVPDADKRLAAYRAAGVEALVLARRPQDGQTADAAGVLDEALARLSETVAVLDLGEGGLAGRDAAAQMAMSVVGREGRGVVLGDDRLGAGLALAGREGIPAAELLRDLDGEGQDGAAIRRGLDDTVRRAVQEGRGIVLARVKADTLAALAEWSREGRAGDVTVAPVSGVLGAEQQ